VRLRNSQCLVRLGTCVEEKFRRLRVALLEVECDVTGKHKEPRI